MEHWLGTDLGRDNKVYEKNYEVYHELFGSEESPVHGLALGIGGDQTSQLLYRLLNGELVNTHAKVYWVLIGTNDRLGEHCSRDMILSGNIQIVETILAAKPNATVVVSSILPYGRYPLTAEKNLAWQYVRSINEGLACYVASRGPRVEFFNATDYFLTTDKMRVNETFMVGDMLRHPSGEGSQVWGKGIVERVQEILSGQTR